MVGHNQICPLCQSYLQYYPDPTNPLDHLKYLKCSCGFTKLAKEQLPEIPSNEEINNKLEAIEQSKI